MTEPVFAADPARLLIAAAAGILLLLLLIIKFKIHPVLSLLIAALVIGLGAGMPVPTLVSTVENGAGETLQGIILLIGLGSLFGGILEVSGGAQCVAQTLINKFGEKKAGIALGITGLVVGTTVFFEAGVVILIPLAFGLAKKTKKSTLYYVIPAKINDKMPTGTPTAIITPRSTFSIFATRTDPADGGINANPVASPARRGIT